VLGTSFEERPIPSDMLDLVEEYREKLVEAAVEMDDEVMEKYLEGEDVTADEIRMCLRKGTIERKIVQYWAVLPTRIKAFSRCWMQ